VKRPSVLESLRKLREQAREAEKLRLADSTRAADCAHAAEDRTRQQLSTEQTSGQAARLQEQVRLCDKGVSAAEGQRSHEWARSLRRREQQLTDELNKATVSSRQAAAEAERARVAMIQAQLDLEGVSQRLAREARAQELKRDQARQESTDERSLRRFLGRGDA
jgi:hypothetical protein